LTPRLEQQEERNETVGLHGIIKLRKHDSECQLSRR
jgi:hypothetical protein